MLTIAEDQHDRGQAVGHTDHATTKLMAKRRTATAFVCHNPGPLNSTFDLTGGTETPFSPPFSATDRD
jgi:hypothetical protein